MLIIRRNDFIYATLVIFNSGMNFTLQTRESSRVTNAKCRIDKVISPGDGHTVARNM